jgi:hypothetical protein
MKKKAKLYKEAGELALTWRTAFGYFNEVKKGE